MLTEQERAWAQQWKRTPDELLQMRRELHEIEKHRRLFYRKGIDELDDDELKCAYIDLKNTLSGMYRG